jgi:hypothetical protein
LDSAARGTLRAGYIRARRAADHHHQRIGAARGRGLTAALAARRQTLLASDETLTDLRLARSSATACACELRQIEAERAWDYTR